MTPGLLLIACATALGLGVLGVVSWEASRSRAHADLFHNFDDTDDLLDGDGLASNYAGLIVPPPDGGTWFPPTGNNLPPVIPYSPRTSWVRNTDGSWEDLAGNNPLTQEGPRRFCDGLEFADDGSYKVCLLTGGHEGDHQWWPDPEALR